MANASHAVNDFRKLAGIECYAPTDNVSELSARINDEGWETSYRNWLQGSRLGENDAVFVLSVGAGDEERNISSQFSESTSLCQASRRGHLRKLSDGTAGLLRASPMPALWFPWLTIKPSLRIQSPFNPSCCTCWSLIPS